MINFKQLTAVALVLGISASTVIAQDNAHRENKKEKQEEIIIRKNGPATEKMVIIVDGNDITVNGKPASEFKEGQVIIKKIEKGMREFAPGAKAFAIPPVPPLPGHNAFLGVATEKAEGGAKIIEVTSESAAAKAGLKEGDIITSIDNKKIEDHENVVAVITEKKPNDKISITYLRDGKKHAISATLGEHKSRAFSFKMDGDYDFDMPGGLAPMVRGFMSQRPKVGLQIEDLPDGPGVKVKEVDEDSPAAKAGIKEGDILTDVNGKNVAGVIEMREAISGLKEGDTFKVMYKRGNKTGSTEIKFPKKIRSATL